MISDKTSLSLQAIAKAGGSLDVDGSAYTSLALQGIARSLANGATLTVSNSSGLTSIAMQSIAGAKPGQVFFK